MNNQNEIIKLTKVKVYCVNRRRISDDKNNFVTEYIASIVVCAPTHSICNHTKHTNIPRTIKYRLFKRHNINRKQLIDTIVDINWSLENKGINKFPKVNYDLMIQIQY